MLTLLRQRNFALLWCGQLISALGDWILFIALPFFVYDVYDLTGSALATGAMFIVQIVPSLVLGSLAGVFVDRWDRKRTMVLANVTQALVLLLLLAVRAREWLWIVYLVTFIQSTIFLFFSPAKDALIPRLVGRQRLMAANSLNALSDNLARLVGPSVGGALLGLAGLGTVVLVDSLSFLISGAMIALISMQTDRPGEEPTDIVSDASGRMTLWCDWLEGLLFVKQQSLLTVLFIVNGTVMLAEGIINVLFIVFVRDVLQGGGLEFGWLMAARGLGAVVGGFIVGYVGKMMAPTRLNMLSAVMIGLMYLVMFNFTALLSTLILFALSGVPGVAYGVSVRTLLQSSVVDSYRGRIFGTFDMTSALMLLGGVGLAGALGDFLGVIVLLNAVGALYVGAGIIALVMLRRGSEADKPMEVGDRVAQ